MRTLSGNTRSFACTVCDWADRLAAAAVELSADRPAAVRTFQLSCGPPVSARHEVRQAHHLVAELPRAAGDA